MNLKKTIIRNKDAQNHHELLLTLEKLKPLIEKLYQEQTGKANNKKNTFYPEDLTQEEWEEALKTQPEDHDTLNSPYTIIRREGTKLATEPYHEVYQPILKRIATILRKASRQTEEQTLKQYLLGRAKALLNDNYEQSEEEWLQLKGDIELTIGPYEIYDDKERGLKASYELFVGTVDHEATENVLHLQEAIPLLNKEIPLSERYKNNNENINTPIRIVNEVLTAGTTNNGIHFTAFNLPNDEKIKATKGSKKVLIKNIAEAKFSTCWQPLVEKAFTYRVQKHATFDAYYLHVILHEISHGLGPGIIQKEGKTLSVNQALKETYSILEEAKADLLGVHNAYVLADKGIIEEKEAQDVLYTYLAGTIRSIRFGIDEAHGGANSIVLNWLLKREAVLWQADRLGLKEKEALEGIRLLLEKILIIQAKGNKIAAEELIAKYQPPQKKIKNLLDELKDIPIDIEPHIIWKEEPGEEP